MVFSFEYITRLTAAIGSVLLKAPVYHMVSRSTHSEYVAMHTGNVARLGLGSRLHVRDNCIAVNIRHIVTAVAMTY